MIEGPRGLPAVLRAERSFTTEELDARRAEGGAFPIVEPGVCTFAYAGPVEAVRLVHFGVGLPDDLSFEPVDDSEWWVLPLAVPDGSRVEYKLEVLDSWGHHLDNDALNPNVATNPFGANSVCEAHGYAPPLCASYADDVPRGTFRDVQVSSAAFGRDVTVTVYEPAALANGERAPLVVVHDGGDYLRYASASTVLDNLIQGDVIPPTFAAFVQPGERLGEYADDPRHATFLTDELVPRLEAELPLIGSPNGRCLMGASFGAVASLAAARRAPGTYGRLLLQSGSFASAGVGCRRRAEPLWRPVRRFVQDYLADPVAVAEKAFVSCGAFESLICENRGLVPVLRATGMEVNFVETLDGHNWVCWRDSLGIALPWLFTNGD